mmetsp:Transcript_42219/g.83543  ORF Transcript_42219/g.83543 Transcript_42219/m.83543 type:complete len:206 (+) Transcript_42219:1596-2213(+)
MDATALNECSLPQLRQRIEGIQRSALPESTRQRMDCGGVPMAIVATISCCGEICTVTGILSDFPTDADVVVGAVGAFGVAGGGDLALRVSVAVAFASAVVRTMVTGAGVVGTGPAAVVETAVVAELLAVVVCVAIELLLLDAGAAEAVVASEAVDACTVGVVATCPCAAWTAAALQQLWMAPCLSGQQLPNLPLQAGEAPQDRNR